VCKVRRIDKSQKIQLKMSRMSQHPHFPKKRRNFVILRLARIFETVSVAPPPQMTMYSHQTYKEIMICLLHVKGL